MPASYLIDMPRGIVFSRGWGLLTDAEILSHVQTLRADPRFDPGFRQVIDFCELHEIQAAERSIARLEPARGKFVPLRRSREGFGRNC
jgi:hypothetical protein